MKSHIIRKALLFRPVDQNFFNNTAIDAKNFWGLVAVAPTFMYERHLAALSRVLKFHYRRRKRRRGFFMINLKFSSFLTKKAIGVRMGKGKGGPDEKVLFMRPGFLILSVNDHNPIRASYILNKCKRRLPVPSYTMRVNA